MKKSRICWIRILFPVLSVLLFSIFLLTIKVNAASSDAYPLPFYVNYYHDSYFSDSFVLDSSLQSELESYGMFWIGDIYDSNNSWAWAYAYYPRPNSNFTFIFSNADLNGTVSYENFNFSYDYVIMSGSFIRKSIRLKKSTGIWGDAYVTTTNLNNTSITLLGKASTDLNSYGYTPNIPFFISDSLTYSDGDNNLIFTNGEPVIDNRIPGVATRPDKQERLDFLHNNKPDHVPDPPTINNYSWTTYNNPPVDTTDLESLISSLIDIISYNFSYLFINLSGLFSNLISNIGSYFEYLGELISYGFDVVVNNIIAGIENFYDNMVSLVEPLVANVINIGSFIAAFYALGLDQAGNFTLTQMFTSLFVPSSQQIIQAVLDHDDFDFIGTSKVVIADAPRILSQLYNVTATPVFHVPSCTFHGVEIGNFDISFAWFAPYKVYYDVIVSTFLIIAYIYWIFVTMHSHIRTTYTPGPQEEEYWRY